jgi:protein-tyrosine phosphatase
MGGMCGYRDCRTQNNFRRESPPHEPESDVSHTSSVNSDRPLNKRDGNASQASAFLSGHNSSDGEKAELQRPVFLDVSSADQSQRARGNSDGDDSIRNSISSSIEASRSSIGVLMDSISAIKLGTMSEPIFQIKPMLRDASAALTLYIPTPMTEILPALYIGSNENASKEENLRQKGLTHILSLIGNQSCFNWVKQKQYVMSDHGKTNIKEVLNEVYEFMEEGQKGNNKLLVHCLLGQNRSAVVIILFLMKNQKKTLFRAHRDLRKLRPIVQVNVRYARQLLEFEKELYGKNSLPSDWMEQQFDDFAGEVVYKYEDLTTPHHCTLSPETFETSL